jgi:hypothetical protein
MENMASEARDHQAACSTGTKMLTAIHA